MNNGIIAPTTRNRAQAELILRQRRGETTSDKSHYLPDNQSVRFTAFKQHVYPRYVRVNYQDLLDSKLEQVARYIETGGKEGIGRLIVNLPPRCGKTMTISRLFPAWVIGRNPDKRLMLTAYGASLAKKNSRFVRNLIRSKRYQEIIHDVALSDDTASAQEWDIAGHDGGAIAAGVGGSIIGHGAHLLIIDDPIKSRAEAESPTYRERVKEWYSDAYTRLEEPGAAIVIMHTRWHQDDLVGHLLNEDEDSWVVLNLPAEAMENDPLGRQPGEALWPERYPLEKLAKIRETLGEYRYSAEYQQKPLPKSGNLFDTSLIDVIDYIPECTKVVRFYDLAVTAKKKSDYTVGVKMGVTADEKFVILDVWRKQQTLPDIQEGIVQNAKIDGPAVAARLEAEKAGIVELDYLLRDPRMRPYTLDAKPPDGDKYVRAGPFAARVKNKRVQMIQADWNRAYLDELSVFASGANDDQVDASSGAYDMLTEEQVQQVFDNINPADVGDYDYRAGELVVGSALDGYDYGDGPGAADYRPRVFLLAQETEDSITVFAEYYETEQPDPTHAIEAISGLGYEAPHVTYISPDDDVLRTALIGSSWMIAKVKCDWQEAVKNTRRLFTTRKIKIHSRCKNLIRELAAYHIDPRKPGIPFEADHHGIVCLRNLTWHMRYLG